MYKSFAITGSQPLLKAMEETLVKEGFKSSTVFSFIDGGNSDGDLLVSNFEEPKDKKEYLQLCAYDKPIRCSQRFNLPEQWNEVLDFILGQLKPEVKVGDWVTFLKNFDGKRKGYVTQIERITEDCVSDKGWVSYRNGGFRVRGSKGNGYVLDVDFRFSTPQEIEAAQIIKIGSYKAEKVGNTIKFGCQSFNMEELQAYKKLLNDNINAKIEISGTTITKDILDRLINKL